MRRRAARWIHSERRVSDFSVLSSVVSGVAGRWMPLLLPKSKKRTALLGKLKEIFRVSRSQPVGGVNENINPILRGWVKYFAIGHSSRCFSYIRD
jgi:hypothetical protein